MCGCVCVCVVAVPTRAAAAWKGRYAKNSLTTHKQVDQIDEERTGEDNHNDYD